MSGPAAGVAGAAGATGAAGAFEVGLRGQVCWLDLADGRRVELPVTRWHAPADHADEVLLAACQGPTVDLGCGPGRLAAALTGRGVMALGVDSSPVAVALTRARGAAAVRRDVFDRLPGEGRWHHALLADGNIGIGGDPVALLRRAARLVRRRGSVLVEVDPPGSGSRRHRARVAGQLTRGGWFDWATVDRDALAGLAQAAGLRVCWLVERAGRWFAEVRHEHG